MLEILNGREKFYQWDINQKVVITDENVIAVHYDNGSGDALICGVYELDGQRVADVPNLLLQSDWDIKLFACCAECVRYARIYEVERRSRPNDYFYTETETLNYSQLYKLYLEHDEIIKEIAAKSVELEKELDGLNAITVNIENKHNEDIGNLETMIDANADNIASVNYRFLEYKNTTDKKLVKQETKIAGLESNLDIQVKNIYESLNEKNVKLNDHEKRINKLELNGGGTGGTASEVDWSENDTTSPAYIKNRTHYVDYGIWDVLPQLTIETFEDDGIKGAYIPEKYYLEPETEYKVIYNGTEYITTTLALNAAQMVAGNMVLINDEDNGMPFMLMGFTKEASEEIVIGEVPIYGLVYVFDGSETVTLNIKREGELIHKLDNKYIDHPEPDYGAKIGEEGYIKNRTHWREDYGTFVYDPTQTYESFFSTRGYTAYKISDTVLPDLHALNNLGIHYYASSNTGFFTDYTVYRNDWESSYGWVEYKNNAGVRPLIGIITILNADIAQMNDYISQSGTQIPGKGTYIYVSTLQDLGKVEIVADGIIHKLGSEYLELSSYYTRYDVDKKLKSYYTKTETDAAIATAVENAGGSSDATANDIFYSAHVSLIASGDKMNATLVNATYEDFTKAMDDGKMPKLVVMNGDDMLLLLDLIAMDEKGMIFGDFVDGGEIGITILKDSSVILQLEEYMTASQVNSAIQNAIAAITDGEGVSY